MSPGDTITTTIGTGRDRREIRFTVAELLARSANWNVAMARTAKGGLVLGLDLLSPEPRYFPGNSIDQLAHLLPADDADSADVLRQLALLDARRAAELGTIEEI